MNDLGSLVADRIAAALTAGPGDGRGAGGRPTPIHFVGHSLGGILFRWLVAHQPPGGLGRIVLLGSPNCGSRLADFTRPWLRWLFRPIPDLTTDATNICHTIPTPGDSLRPLGTRRRRRRAGAAL